MNHEEYFKMLKRMVEEAYGAASKARAIGYDPQTTVEILQAYDLPSRVEGIIGLKGIAELIRKSQDNRSRYELAFDMVKKICTDESFESDSTRRLTMAVRVGLAILTEGVQVAPTEGVQGIELHKNQDGTSYAAVLYAGPIRGAGGTSAALSVALTDYGRRLLDIGTYRATQSEIERYIEEIDLYEGGKAHLQYKPPEQDIRTIIGNCPVCIDGLPSGLEEVNIHKNMQRLDASGKQQILTNKIRGGACLVICEGIAQKAKSVLRYTKNAGLDWSWLNDIIRIEKPVSADKAGDESDAVFLQELVAGRPIFAYPKHAGSFRLRYGRSRLTGIAAKGLNPATMYLLGEFLAIGTQLKVETPGKGCVVMPVDSIEGPFVELETGEAFRINSIEEAQKYKSSISKILSVGDILVTYGDFKKSNTALLPTSYVEEYWIEQLKAKGCENPISTTNSFEEAYKLSKQYDIPIHPRFTYDYNEISKESLLGIADAVLHSNINKEGERVFDVKAIKIQGTYAESVRDAIETICIPHIDSQSITLIGDDAQCLLASLGFVDGNEHLHLAADVLEKYVDPTPLEILNKVAPFAIMRRSTRIGGRMGRPEKAKERKMAASPQVLFPVGEYGGKERNVAKAYMVESRSLGSEGISVEMPRYRCDAGGEYLNSVYCKRHKSRAIIERKCTGCGRFSKSKRCENCGSITIASELKTISIVEIANAAVKELGITSLPNQIKGVKGLLNDEKVYEPLEKGILRSMHGVYVFRDGTARFDATDAPMTHFYPREINTSVEGLRGLGYTKDYLGNELERDDQLVELMHQDIVVNKRCVEYVLKVAKFIDDLLVRYYKLEPFYNAESAEQLVGKLVITLSPHTSAGVVGRIIGFTNANVCFAHPYLICARRRNCDGDEDTTILLLDALINFSKSYLPTSVGSTMDTSLVLTVNVQPEEIDDEVYAMEVVENYPMDFYESTLNRVMPSEAKLELVESRLKSEFAFSKFRFSHKSGVDAITGAPKKSAYTTLATMQDKINAQFRLMDKLCTVDRRDTAKRLILSHFIPDLMGNLHSFSKQSFRCTACNTKYRRVPIRGSCTRCGGKLLLTISRGGVEKYLNTALRLAEKYDLDVYVKQRVLLLKQEIDTLFGLGAQADKRAGQFNLARFM